MDYMTLKEASEKWGVSSRQINYYCTDGRIPGAVKMAGVWLIPKEAENRYRSCYKKWCLEFPQSKAGIVA